MVPHCQPALVPSSASTTSGSPFSRPSLGTWCFIPCYPLFLRRQAPRPAPHFPDRVRGRGASSLANPCSFVGKHHVLHSKVPGSPGGVVPHCPPALISSSSGTTSSASKCRAAPGAWCLTARQPFFVGRHHVRRLSVPTVPGDVVPHCPLVLVPSSRSTTSAGTNPRRRHPAVLYMRLDFSKSRFFSINVY